MSSFSTFPPFFPPLPFFPLLAPPGPEDAFAEAAAARPILMAASRQLLADSSSFWTLR